MSDAPQIQPHESETRRNVVTIVTVVRNAKASISATIESVLRLKTGQVEYIIRDGASTDGTQKIIETYSDIDFYQSEPDSGIYDAMNRGAREASGDFILFLNAGDILISLPIKELQAASPDEWVVSFPVLINNADTFYPSAGAKLCLANTLHHQGTFYRRATVPEYDLRYKVFADFDLNTKLARAGRVACHRAPTVAIHFTDGISNRRESVAELFTIVRKWHGFTGLVASLSYFKLRGLLWRLHIRI